MNTAAYLTKHGWLGTGHSLHPNGNGIKKPIRVVEKLDVLGVGKKKHDIHADQWWARMFDSTLKDLQVGENQSSTTSERKHIDVLSHRPPTIVPTSSLYGNFVKGEGLVGTVEVQTVKQAQTNANIELQCKEETVRESKSRRIRKIEEVEAEKSSRSHSSPSYEEQKEARRLQRRKRKEDAREDRSRRKARKKLQDDGNER